MGFKENLKDEISYQGLQIKELAATAGINYGSFLSYVDVRGRIPSVEVGVKIAQVLGVTAEYLVTGSDSTIENLRDDFIPFRNFNKKLKQLSKSSWEKLEPLFVAMIEQELKSELEKKKSRVEIG